MPVNYLRYWRRLINRGLVGAAAGLLDDLFVMLARFEGELPADASAFLTETRDDARRDHHEQAMEILNDGDGSELRRWIELYRNNYPAFQTLARDWAYEARILAEENLNRPLE